MAFNQASINYAKNYGVALNQVFPYVLHFGALRSPENDTRYRFSTEKTIEIPTLSVSGRRNADRDAVGAKARRYNNSWTPLTLENERKWDTLVHPKDIDQTNMVASIQNITQVFNEEQKFPEMDAYLISKAYSEWRSCGKIPDTVSLSAENVLIWFDKLMERMTNHRVPVVGRILYIVPAVDTMLKQAQGLARSINVQTDNPAIYRSISNLDRVTIEVVPDELMKTAYDFTEGWVVGVSAKQIKMVLIHPSVIITPTSYETVLLDPPSAGSDGKWSYYEESHEDVFMLATKIHAAEFIVDDPTLPALSFTTEASTVGVAGYTKISGMNPTLGEGDSYLYKTHATAVALPALGETLTGWSTWDGDDEIAVANGQKIAIVAVNSEGKAVCGAVKTAVSSTGT